MNKSSKLLFSEAKNEIKSKFYDIEPYIPNKVFEYRLNKAKINPFGIISINGLPLTVANYSNYNFNLLLKIRIILSHFIKKKHKIDQSILSVNNIYYNNYYHFVMEVLQRVFLLRNYLSSPENAKILLPRSIGKFHLEWIKFLNLENKILIVDDNILVEPKNAFTCDFPANSSNYHPEIIQGFKSWVQSFCSEGGDNLAIQDIFSRNPKGRRKIVNHDAVIKTVSDLGFHYIEPENLTLKEQSEIFFNATHIIGIHGAAFSNLIFCNQSPKILEIINQDFHYHFFEKLAKSLDYEYSALKCRPHHDSKYSENHADLIVDIEVLRANILKLLS